MVRNYKRKTTRGSKYTKDDLQAALGEIAAGRLTEYAASKRFKIPTSTISNHRRGIRGAHSNSQGRSTAIPLVAETKLAECLKCMEKWGFGLTRKEVMDLVGQYVDRNHLVTVFKNGRPGEDWFLKFKERHGLSLKKPQAVEYARKKAVDPFPINNYFNLLEPLIAENKFDDKPQLIYNLDESSFCLDPTKTKIVGKRNAPASRTTSGPAKENVTVLIGASATGHKLPPMIIFKAKYIWDQWLAPEDKAFPNTAYAATKNGWMEADVFLRYMEKTFIPNVPKERPILLIFDGHSTHIDERTIRLAIDNEIIILKLPPHSSHLLQPLDLAVFKPLKDCWDAKLVSWQRKHIGQKLSKKCFAQFIGEIWTETNKNNIVHGFRKGGICPFNREVVAREKFDPEALRRWDAARQVQVNGEDPPNTGALARTTRTDDAINNQIPSTSTNEPGPRIQDNQPRLNITFENLVLQEMKQTNREEKKTKKRVAQGAEVITNLEVLERMAAKKIKPLEPPKKLKRKRTKSSKAKDDESSEESDFSEIMNVESDSENETLEDLRKRYELEEMEISNEKDLNVRQNIKVGTWVLVEFATKKTKKHFVGQIVEITVEDLKIKFTRKKEDTLKSIFYWPEVEDESVVNEDSVVKLLPEPNLGRRGELIFLLGFNSFNIF